MASPHSALIGGITRTTMPIVLEDIMAQLRAEAESGELWSDDDSVEDSEFVELGNEQDLLAFDDFENVNLAQDPAHKEKLDEMLAQLRTEVERWWTPNPDLSAKLRGGQ